jgi:hypothetical protein
MKQQAYRGAAPGSIRSERGQIILQLREPQSKLTLDPEAARDLASQLMSRAIEVQTEGDRVLGVTSDGSRSDPEREGL